MTPTARKKRRQAMRRQRRDVLQNTMVLLGWVPVKIGPYYGLHHRDTKRTAQQAYGSGAYSYLPQHVDNRDLTECNWLDMQASWMRNLRAVLIQQKWLQP